MMERQSSATTMAEYKNIDKEKQKANKRLDVR
jgi:hypothetical protein